LFISEFLMVKTLFANAHYFVAVVFLSLLTIIIYGMGKSLLRMSYGDISPHHTTLEQTDRPLSWTMYFPQVVLLTISVIIGLYMPDLVNKLIQSAAGVL
jgi:hydrogenase-4 component F